MNRTLVFVAALAVFLAVGCDSAKPDNYYPVGVGSTWTYETWTTLETAVEGLDTTMTATIEVRVTTVKQLAAGGDVAEFVSKATVYTRLPDPDTTVTVDTQYVRDAGDWILTYESLDDAEPDTVLPSEPAAGKSWHATDSLVMTLEGQEDIEVAAGMHRKAWRAFANLGAGSEVKQWFGNHTGLILVHSEIEPQSGFKIEARTELVSSDVKE